MSPTLAELRRFAVARSLFAPTSLELAIERLGFVQADPIRAPARAQDLTLRHRVSGYRAGDLERGYAELAIEEDAFINYGFLPRRHLSLMHPRTPRRPWSRAARRHATRILDFVRERGEVHPREVDAHLALGTVVNYWGGSSSATTQLLEDLHYRGMLRVARRDAGVRVYALRVADQPELGKREQADALLALAIAKYAPLPGPALGQLASRLRYAAPQLSTELAVAVRRAKERLPHATCEGVDWYWPGGDDPSQAAPSEEVRLLAPFDPVVWDRRRFELFWGWAYRFEAYTPVAKRKLGYYALPLLWRDAVMGWANLSLDGGALNVDLGFIAGRPRERAFKQALDAELERVREFLGL